MHRLARALTARLWDNTQLNIISWLILTLLQIDLNGCVERWCRRVLLTNCKAVGAKLIITNGEEYEQLNKMEDIVCCVACFPVWLIQTGIYKVQRLISNLCLLY